MNNTVEQTEVCLTTISLFEVLFEKFQSERGAGAETTRRKAEEKEGFSECANKFNRKDYFLYIECICNSQFSFKFIFLTTQTAHWKVNYLLTTFIYLFI